MICWYGMMKWMKWMENKGLLQQIAQTANSRRSLAGSFVGKLGRSLVNLFPNFLPNSLPNSFMNSQFVQFVAAGLCWAFVFHSQLPLHHPFHHPIPTNHSYQTEKNN
jgi:hypothetical protein